MPAIGKLLLTHRKCAYIKLFFFSSRRRHTRLQGDWSSDVCSSDLKFFHCVEESVHNLLGAAGAVLGDNVFNAYSSKLLIFGSAGIYDPVTEEDEQIGRASCRERV